MAPSSQMRSRRTPWLNARPQSYAPPLGPAVQVMVLKAGSFGASSGLAITVAIASFYGPSSQSVNV